MSLTLEQLSTGSGNLQEDTALGHRRSVTARKNAVRNAGVLHRSAISAVDKLITVVLAAPLDAGAEAGSNLANSAMNCAMAAGNAYGVQASCAAQAVTPTVNHPIVLTPTPVVGADYYDIFLSTDTPPKWVARATVAQIAAGSLIVSTVGTITADAGANKAAAGSINIGIVGTGLGSTVAPFSVNNAYTPGVPTPVSCVGYEKARILTQIIPTDCRSAPGAAKWSVFGQSQVGGIWFQITTFTQTPLTAVQQPLTLDTSVTIDGCTAIVVLLDTLATGQGITHSVYVELA